MRYCLRLMLCGELQSGSSVLSLSGKVCLVLR